MEKKVSLPRWEDLPKIDLYIDQVVSLLNEWLSVLPNSEEHVVTKTMINNYVKHGMVEAPKKKKYTTTHLAYFLIVCIFKNVYSMNEITDMITLQVHAFPLEQAYNYYIEDFEYCAKAVINGEKVRHAEEANKDPLKTLLHAVNESLVNKFFVQENVRIQKELDLKRRKEERKNARVKISTDI